MTLTALLDELAQASGPVTGIELADRLGVAPARVAAMLDALRASGRLGPQVRQTSAPDSCASGGSCSLSCPGPDKCALTVDLSITALRIQPVTGS